MGDMRKTAALALAAVLVASVLTGCSDTDRIDSGLVVSRTYNVASVRPMVAASWALYIEKGKFTNWIEVSEETYDKCFIGTHFPECAD